MRQIKVTNNNNLNLKHKVKLKYGIKKKWSAFVAMQICILCNNIKYTQFYNLHTNIFMCIKQKKKVQNIIRRRHSARIKYY